MIHDKSTKLLSANNFYHSWFGVQSNQSASVFSAESLWRPIHKGFLYYHCFDLYSTLASYISIINFMYRYVYMYVHIHM